MKFYIPYLKKTIEGRNLKEVLASLKKKENPVKVVKEKVAKRYKELKKKDGYADAKTEKTPRKRIGVIKTNN